MQIQIFLGQLSNVINEAFQLLRRLHGTADSDDPCLNPLPSSSNPSSATTLTPNLSSRNSRKGPKPFARLKWSFYDKRRVEDIITNFSDLNRRILENIKLWCLGTSIGVDLQHLKRLEDNENSKRLGFDIDARLQLTASDAEVIEGTLELSDKSLKQYLQKPRKIEDRFALIEWDGEQMVLEYRKYASVDSPGLVDIDPRMRDRVDRLAKLLHQPKEHVFRIPACKGWVLDILSNQVAYIFAVPSNICAEPYSLLRALGTPDLKPTLGQKFRLAHELSRCISQLQLVQWVRR